MRLLPAILAVFLLPAFGGFAQFQPDPERRAVDLPPGAGEPVPVAIDFFLLDVNGVDGSEETFSAELYLELRWKDDRMRFDAEKFGSDRALYPGTAASEQLGRMWSPAVDVENLAGAPDTIDECLTIHSDGTVEYERRITGVFSSPMELGRYPFDSQTLEVRLESFLWNSSEVRLVIDSSAEQGRSHLNESINLRGWRFVSFAMNVGEHRYVTGDAYASFVSSMVVKRDPWFCIWAVIFPLVLVTFFVLTSFFWDQSVLSERIALAMYGMLTVAAQGLLVTSDLPRISYFTRVDYAVFLTYAVLLAVASVSVVTRRVDLRDPAFADRIDLRAAWIIALGYLTGLGILFVA